MKKVKILYLDDEVNNLNSFKANYKSNYDILTCLNAKEAYDILEKNKDIVIILCDNRMSSFNGVDFLERVRIDYPKPVRMLITGYSDIESVIKSINDGHIFQYIKKPIDVDIEEILEKGKNYYNRKISTIEDNKYKKINNPFAIINHEDKNENREDVASKLSIINNIIRKGYDSVYKSISNNYKEYCLSIKNMNYFALREDLIKELCPLVA